MSFTTKNVSFPSHTHILMYLEHHPLTQGGGKKHKQVYEAVARILGNRVASQQEIDKQVLAQVIGHLDLSYQRHPEKTIDLICRIAGALTDYAPPRSKL